MLSGRDEPGIGITWSPRASSQASVTRCGETPKRPATSDSTANRSPTRAAPEPPPSGDQGTNAMPRWPQKSSSCLLVWLNFGENSFCTAARPPSPRTSRAIWISSTDAFEMPISETRPSCFSAAKFSMASA